MRIDKDKYYFIITVSIEDTIIVMIVDKEKDKVIDVATLELKVYNEITNTIDIDIKSLFDRSKDIFEETRIAIDIYSEINKARNNRHTGDNEDKTHETV